MHNPCFNVNFHRAPPSLQLRQWHKLGRIMGIAAGLRLLSQSKKSSSDPEIDQAGLTSRSSSGVSQCSTKNTLKGTHSYTGWPYEERHFQLHFFQNVCSFYVHPYPGFLPCLFDNQISFLDYEDLPVLYDGNGRFQRDKVFLDFLR